MMLASTGYAESSPATVNVSVSLSLSPTQIVASYIAQAKTDEILDDLLYRKLSDDILIAELLPYLKDPKEDENTRSRIVNQFKSIAVHNPSAALRRRAVEAVVESTLQYSETQFTGLLAARPSDFTAMARTMVLRLNQKTKQHPDLIRLAGSARVRELEPELRELNARLANEPKAIDYGDFGTKVDKSPEYPRGKTKLDTQESHLQAAVWYALACFGDSAAVQNLLTRAKVQRSSLRRGDLLQEVAWTRNPEAIKMVMPFVFSSEAIAESGDMGGWSLRADVQASLSRVIEDFPTEDEVTKPIFEHIKAHGLEESMGMSVVDTRDDKVRQWLAQPGYGFKVKK